jgi:acyl dehydratase
MGQNAAVKPRQEKSWMHQQVARNDATSSENRIHSDDVARQYGFRGGLVPGVTVYAYLVAPVVAALGRRWLEQGVMTARFLQPVYDGDTVTATATTSGDGRLQLELRDSGGNVCATGTAADEPLVDGAPLELSAFPAVLRPPRDQRPPASADVFAQWPVLGELVFTVDGAQPNVLITDEQVVDPGWLLRSANYALSGTVRLGPWIHVESDVQHLGLVHDGDTVHVRARVDDVFEKRGHRFVVLNVVWLLDAARPVMRARHTAIYEPRVVEASV